MNHKNKDVHICSKYRLVFIFYMFFNNIYTHHKHFKKILKAFLLKNKKAVRLMAQLIKFYKFYYLLYLNKRWLNSQ